MLLNVPTHLYRLIQPPYRFLSFTQLCLPPASTPFLQASLTPLIYYYYVTICAADFAIGEMDYIPHSDMILVINTSKIIIADPYTLQSRGSVPVSLSQHCVMIANTKLAVITMQYNQLNIFDTELVKIVKTLDNSKFTSATSIAVLQQLSHFYTLTSGESIILCTDNKGVFTWTFDTNSLLSTYNGYIPSSNSKALPRAASFQKYHLSFPSFKLIIRIIDYPLSHNLYLT